MKKEKMILREIHDSGYERPNSSNQALMTRSSNFIQYLLNNCQCQKGN
jgi:hypothetical protein